MPQDVPSRARSQDVRSRASTGRFAEGTPQGVSSWAGARGSVATPEDTNVAIAGHVGAVNIEIAVDTSRRRLAGTTTFYYTDALSSCSPFASIANQFWNS